MCRAQMNSRAQLRRYRQQPKQHAAIKRSSFSWNMTIVLLCRFPWSWNVVTLSVTVIGAEATRLPLRLCPWCWTDIAAIAVRGSEAVYPNPSVCTLTFWSLLRFEYYFIEEPQVWVLFMNYIFFWGGVHPRSESSITAFFFAFEVIPHYICKKWRKMMTHNCLKC